MYKDFQLSMVNKSMIIGITLLAFGLINLLWFTPIGGDPYDNNSVVEIPFPFPNRNLNMPIIGEYFSETNENNWWHPIFNPYWLIWSVAFYLGIVFVSIFGIQLIKQKYI